jgi:DNA-binding PadR family transcriptional regulator
MDLSTHLYPVLHWTERQKTIGSEWRTGDAGERRRRYYGIRKEGRKSLQSEQRHGLKLRNKLFRASTYRTRIP